MKIYINAQIDPTVATFGNIRAACDMTPSCPSCKTEPTS